MSVSEPTRQCQDARVWLSAHRDGEALDDTRHAVHVDGCVTCGEWATREQDLTRRLRRRPSGSPDVVAAALSEWQRQATAPPHRQMLLGRGLLGIAAAVGLALTALALIDPPAYPAGVGSHAGWDLRAFEGGVAMGFLLAAHRPARYSAALLPMVALVAVLTVLPSGADVTAGRVDLLAEASHLSLWIGLAGLLLVLDVRRSNTSGGRRGMQRGIARLS